MWEKDLAVDSPVPWYLPLDKSHFSLSSFRLTSVGRLFTRNMVMMLLNIMGYNFLSLASFWIGFFHIVCLYGNCKHQYVENKVVSCLIPFSIHKSNTRQIIGKNTFLVPKLYIDFQFFLQSLFVVNFVLKVLLFGKFYPLP